MNIYDHENSEDFHLMEEAESKNVMKTQAIAFWKLARKISDFHLFLFPHQTSKLTQTTNQIWSKKRFLPSLFCMRTVDVWKIFLLCSGLKTSEWCANNMMILGWRSISFKIVYKDSILILVHKCIGKSCNQ